MLPSKFSTLSPVPSLSPSNRARSSYLDRPTRSKNPANPNLLSPQRQSISEDFGVSEEAAGLTITLFLLGYCAGPLLFAPLSEFYGRRWIFYITFLLYIAFNFLCAFAPNFGSLLVGRFLTGTFVSAPLSNGPGVLADLWDPVERGNAMAAFSCMVWSTYTY